MVKLRNYAKFIMTLTAAFLPPLLNPAPAPAAVPPPPRSLQEVRKVLEQSPALPANQKVRSLKIVLTANRKDHGPHEHDYPRWMDRWKVLLDSTFSSTAESTGPLAANMYGPPSGPEGCSPGGAHNTTVNIAPDWPTAAQFASADLVVCYMGTGNLWDEKKLRDLQAFLERGGGFVAIHSAVIAENENAHSLADLIGLAWKRGYTGFRHGRLNLKITAPDHPITKGLPEEIPFIDETYWPLIGETTGVEVLATADEKAKGTNQLQPQPMFWTTTHGKGRVYSTILGHYSWTFDDSYFRILLLRGMAWAAGEPANRFDPLVLCGARVKEEAKSKQAETETATPTPPLPNDSNLLLWLDASDTATLTLDSHSVVQWESKSGGSGAVFSSSSGHSPTFQDNTLGNKATVNFDGKDDLLRSVGFGKTADTWTAVIVAAPEPGTEKFPALLSTNQKGLSDYESGLNIDLGPQEAPQFSYLNLEGVKDAPGAYNLRTNASPFSKANIITIVTADGSSRLFINGLEEGGRNATDAVTAMDEVRIGSRYYKGREQSFYKGRIAEILLYDKALPTDELRGLHAHLLEKYGDVIEVAEADELDPWDYLPAYDWGQTRKPLAPIDSAIQSAHGDAASLGQIESRLLKVLRDPATTPAARDFICRRLAYTGSSASVPVLCRMLSNDRQSSVALFALENMRIPEVEAGLQESLAELQGNVLIGVIQMLGNRRSVGSVDKLIGFLNHGDPAIREAAISALGKIGNAKSVHALGTALDKNPAAEHEAIIISLLKCAEQFVTSGSKPAAMDIYRMLSAPSNPQFARVAAIRGEIILQGTAGIPLLLEQIESDNLRFQKMALLLAATLPGTDITNALAGHLAKLTTASQILLLGALADRHDPAARPAVVAVLTNTEPAVQLGAIHALGRLGNAADVPLLTGFASSKDKKLSEAAKTALFRLQDRQADTVILNTMESVNPQQKLALIQVIGRRAYQPAFGPLVALAQTKDVPLRHAALEVLGKSVATSEQVPDLVNLLLQFKDPKDIAAAEKTLTELYARIESKDAWADELAAGLSRANVDQKLALMRALSRHGGEEVLTKVIRAAADSRMQSHDDYIRLLADWPTAEAADNLISIVNESADETHRVIALRGYLRMAGHEDLSTSQRLAMSTRAYDVAWRDEERRAALGIVGQLPSSEALEFAVAQISNQNIQAEAVAAALNISEKLLSRHPDLVRKTAGQILKVEKDPALRARAIRLQSRTSRTEN